MSGVGRLWFGEGREFVLACSNFRRLSIIATIAARESCVTVPMSNVYVTWLLPWILLSVRVASGYVLLTLVIIRLPRYLAAATAAAPVNAFPIVQMRSYRISIVP